MDACVAPLFPEGTFSKKIPDLSFVCTEPDPRRGVGHIKKQVVLGTANGLVSDGMREWALLGWYELAAFAVLRARCCQDAPPLTLPPTPPPCAPLDKTLDELGAAAIAAPSIDDPAYKAVQKRFHDTLYCLVRTGGTSIFGHTGPPRGGQDTAFEKTVARAIDKK
ncbi:MAG TPA: hypothetical protein VLS89_11005 [Candidatus Nanopelagicales bacterium]|nr:hypothetical protein [Candidatus Nanopelagicales bacterium]